MQTFYFYDTINCILGVTTFAQSSGSSNFAGAGSDNINDFDFKDTAQATNTNNNYDSESAGSDNAYNTVWTYPSASANNMLSNNMLQYPDMANYLQQPASTVAVAPPFSPIGSHSLFNQMQYNTDYDVSGNVKPSSPVR